MWPMISRIDVWDPFRELSQLHRNMDLLFDVSGREQGIFPAVNVWSDDNGAVLTAEVPGIEKESIDVNVKGNLLTLEGERKPDELGDDDVYHRRERGYGKYSRTLRLPYEIDPEKVTANYAKGILRVELPRTESSKPRKIAVASE